MAQVSHNRPYNTSFDFQKEKSQKFVLSKKSGPGLGASWPSPGLDPGIVQTIHVIGRRERPQASSEGKKLYGCGPFAAGPAVVEPVAFKGIKPIKRVNKR